MFVTPLGDASNAEESVVALQRAAKFVRRELAARIRVYRIPRIRFQLDPEMLTAEAISQHRADNKARNSGAHATTAQPNDVP